MYSKNASEMITMQTMEKNSSCFTNKLYPQGGAFSEDLQVPATPGGGGVVTND